LKKIVMIVGSLRKNSFNRQLAKVVESIVGERAQVACLQYMQVPFFDQDIEFPTPESVKQVRQVVKEADGIWIFTPEYNYHVPGVLKNLLDWLSRPLVQGDRDRNSVVKGKPVTICGVAGRSEAAGARNNLLAILKAMSMDVVGDSGTGVSLSANEFQTDVLEVSRETEAMLCAQVDLFLDVLEKRM